MINAAFFLWPIISVLFFRKLSLPMAIVAVIIGGYLMLPTEGGWKLPALPAFDKSTLPSVVALILAVAFARSYRGQVQPGWLPRSPIVIGLIALLFASQVGTWLTNRDALFYGDMVIQGLTAKDAIHYSIRSLFTLIPFLLARKFLATREGHRCVLVVLVAWASFYSLLALYEVRMSPQLNVMVYGYFPHSWRQHIRAGGFRPLVFLSHGLVLGVILSTAVIAAFGLWQAGRPPRRVLYLVAGVYLLGTLFLAKTVGALAITLVLLPVFLFLPMRVQALFAGLITIIIIIYPIPRSNGVIPTAEIVERIEREDVERAQSLEFRFYHEDQLLAKAQLRPWFGWGGYGRSRVFDEDGRDISVTDGRWIITLGTGGWTRYVSEMGLASLSILIIALRWRRYSIDRETAVLGIALTANLIDLIPNAGMTPITWLMAGALAGRLELRQTASDPAQVEADSGNADPRAATHLAGQPVGYRRALGQPAQAGANEAGPTMAQGLRFTRFAPRKARSE